MYFYQIQQRSLGSRY